MDRCRGYEGATEEVGPHEPQEMITGRPPAPLEHSDEEEGLEPWEVGLGHCGGYEATEGPYVLQEKITDEPPPPPPPLEPATAADEPWEIEPEQETGARRYPEEMVSG